MKYYIDFSGYCVVEAESKLQAETKFWNNLQKPSTACEDDVYNIDSVEEVADD